GGERNEQPQWVDRAIIRIAAHLPDLIVYGEFAPQFPSLEYFDGVLMFVDISGFTAMTEKFSTAMYMDRGAEQLVEVLNRYISAIVEKVLIYGGDILKFAGDALLALWKVERRLLKNIITVVIKCSLEIHGIFEIQDSEEGLDLRVKIGLSAGHITKVVFGDELRRHFLVIGQAVEDVRFAQGLAQMNEVILSPNCWQLCDRNMIEIERIPDQRAVKVSFLKPPPMFNFDEFFTKCMTYMDFYPTRENQNLLRLACTLESNAELENFLQKYIMENILKQIDDKQLRGYLSELRPVTIVFVNLQFAEHGKIEDVGQAIQDASIHISAVLRTFRGQINKVFMFDKGCSFLCVFGFPGEKAPDEITHALESAIEIFDYCSQIFKIRVVSIGVASGTVFCGIVGHSVRHEYTVIGQKVNIAARMMMNYPGIVSCDSVTYNNCSLPSYFFKELPKQEMKGVVDPGPVYHCLGLNEKIMFGMACLTRNHQEEYPLLGRDKEIQFFVSILNDFVVSSCSRVLMFEGSAGYGKSQLIVELDFLAKSQSHRVISLGLTKISIHQAFYTIQLLMASLLGLDACKHYKERQTNLQVKVGNLIDEKVYCLLNDIFHVQFPMSREASRMSHQEKQKEIEALFTHVLERVTKQEKIIFIIDEAQFIDETSWNFMERVLQRIPIFFILSLSPFFDVPCDAAQAIMKSRDTTYMVLGEMTPADIRAKVCLDLNVASIPKELEMYLVEGSCGVPFYCEELLKNLDRHKVLLFRTLVNEDIKMNVTWDVLFKNFTKPQQVLGIFSLPSVDEGIEVCDLTKGVRLKNMSPPSTLKEISLVQLDSMSLSHQMLVRCAAIIGQTFSTELLFEVLPCWNMKMMIKALAILVESSIFYYFRNRKEFRAVMNQHSSTFEVHYRSIALKPPGGRAAGEEEQIRDLESEVTECSVMCFCKPIMQKTAYELWLKDQKTALHLKCARFLEEDAHQCDRCGNGDFIPFHHYTVDIRLNSLDLDTVKKMIHLHGIHSKSPSLAPSRIQPEKSEVFLEDLSAEQIGGKVLGFFDLILEKIKTPEENLIPIEACQCHEILESVVLPLAYHFMALGEESKALYYYLEVAAAYINVSDNYLAYIYLNEGEKLIKSLKDKKIYHRFETATFFCLKGQVCFNMGQMVLARKMLRKALKLLDRVFPYNCVSVFLQTHVEKTRHYAYLNQPNEESPPPGKKRLAQLYQQTRCLSLLWQIYSLDYTFYCKYFAHLAAMMQVNSALESQDDFQIISAFLDYSLHSQLAGYQGIWFKYEIMAIERTFQLPLRGKGVEIVALVTDKLSYIKHLMGYLDLSIQLGYQAQRMWGLLKRPDKHYLVLCRLSKALFLKNRYKNLIQVLKWLWELSVNEDHIISKAFFYFVCLDLILYGGFVYRPFDECLGFTTQNDDSNILKFHSGIMMGLYSAIAIWYARLQDWESFGEFFNRAKKLVTRRTASVLYCQGFSRFLECQVLFLQRQIEEQAPNAQDSGVELLKNLESLVSRCTTGPIFHPRIYHLMAYVCVLMGDGENCQLFLTTALQLCEAHGNLLEKCWLDLSKKWWYSGKDPGDDHWFQTVLNLPLWDEVLTGRINLEEIEQNKFLMKITSADNPFRNFRPRHKATSSSLEVNQQMLQPYSTAAD
uniref:Adenylate cyclase type 10 n=1 Tax=Ornithorhynchus anatinus TaxID=9258 RepID=A0A6I8PF78_ORNAN